MELSKNELALIRAVAVGILAADAPEAGPEDFAAAQSRADRIAAGIADAVRAIDDSADRAED